MRFGRAGKVVIKYGVKLWFLRLARKDVVCAKRRVKPCLVVLAKDSRKPFQ
jgi:hypothetical protein